MRRVVFQGLAADYTEGELRVMRELARAGDARSGIAIHELKALLGAELVEELELDDGLGPAEQYGLRPI